MSIIEGKSLERYFNHHDALIEFQKLFAYDEPNDLAIAVLGGAFLDGLLENILWEFFPDDKEVDDLLSTGNPVGTYGARVKLVYCLGLIEKAVRDDLRTIGKIRNKFAHQVSTKIGDQQIASWINQFRLHKIAFMDREPPAGATPRDIFQVEVNTLISYLNGIISTARMEKRKVRQNF